MGRARVGMEGMEGVGEARCTLKAAERSPGLPCAMLTPPCRGQGPPAAAWLANTVRGWVFYAGPKIISITVILASDIQLYCWSISLHNVTFRGQRSRLEQFYRTIQNEENLIAPVSSFNISGETICLHQLKTGLFIPGVPQNIVFCSIVLVAFPPFSWVVG